MYPGDERRLHRRGATQARSYKLKRSKQKGDMQALPEMLDVFKHQKS